MEEISISERARNIKLLILDVDGVMTDGRIIYDNFGDEFKLFDVHDGLATSLLKWAGIKLAIVTAKKSKLVKRRARECRAAALYQKAWDKRKAYDEILRKFKLKDKEVCAMGDDLLDAPVFRKAGLAVAVPNAVDELKAIAHYVTKNSGGRGAVRETVELILKSQGKWEGVCRRYFK